jgi:16S rRNA (adenine1518-N6/adenine1519-N6)-dimethyltransferase
MGLLETTKQLCQSYGIKPARSKGQNFLIEEEIYDKMVETAELSKNDEVLEVGPGLGFLTAKLAKSAKKVVAVELDDKLAEVLKTGLIAQGIKNAKVINSDILKVPSTHFIGGEYKVVANLPYNITSIFLRKFLSEEKKPEMMVLMLQREVAERIVASPSKMSLLAVSVQFYAQAEIIKNVAADCFWPQPEVDSAIIKLKIENEDLGINEKEFFRLAKIGFSAKRKMLKNNLANGYRISQKDAGKKIKKCGFNVKIRAQELSVGDWIKLFGEFI